ncbi:MAG: Gfo/Idh/MocA family protein [Pseudorhodobacter sp.]
MGLNIVVAGTGSIGRRHAENFRSLGARVSALSWREAGMEGYRAALNGSDGVVIATATGLRLPLIEAAAAAGLPLYIEKPLAITLAEVEAIAAATAPVAERSMLGYMMRYHPAFRALADSDLGDVFQFSLCIGHDVTQWRENWRFSQSYAAQGEGGGVLLDLCHEIDMAACLFPGLGVMAVESLGHAAYPGVDVASRVSLAGDGISGEVAMDYLTPRLHRRTILRGTEALRDFDFAAQDYRVTGAEAVRLDLPLERNAMFMAAARDFLALVEGRTPSANPHLPRLDRALPSARLVAEARAARRFIGTITKEIP